MKLSQRLRIVANYVPQGSRMADIGSDHGMLPVFLVQSHIAVSAIAGEVNKGPFESARKQVAAANLEDLIDVRLGDGLCVLQDGEVDTICIAGMGGSLIVTILQHGMYRLSEVQRLILQPNVGEHLVRAWLYNNGWELKAESILKEDGVIYEILCAQRGNPETPYQDRTWSLQEWFQLGPFLWRNGQQDVYKEKWTIQRNKLVYALQNLQKARTPLAEQKEEELLKHLTWVEEVLRCLPTDKP